MKVIQRARQARRPGAGLREGNGKSTEAAARERKGPQRSGELPTNPTDTDVTRFNALRHGVLSQYTILPWEDEDEYIVLLDALVAEHKPQGPTEEHLVEEVIGILWRKRRLRRAEGAICRRGIKNAPSNETIVAALSHLSVAARAPGDNAKLLAELAQRRASIASTLKMLKTGKTRSYDTGIVNLPGDTRKRWEDLSRATKVELHDYTRPTFSKDEDGLTQFLESEILRHEARREELENEPLIHEQVLGESLHLEMLEGLARYEVHLDRKLDRMLSLLIRLQDLRRLSPTRSI